MRYKLLPLILFIFLLCLGQAFAVPTNITVRVKTKDAKFLGTNMGGALVIIKNVITGELLARGITEGSTGDTKHIMKDSRERGISLSDENSAKYTAVIDIDEPTYIEVVAEGPISEPQAKNSAGITQWVIPGKHISEGDALLLEISGLLVKILAPPKESVFSELSRNVEIYTMVRMLSGSTLTPDGIWDANKFEIKAVIKKGGKVVEEVTLEYAGRPSLFSGTFTSEEAGTYDLIVYAYDPANGNTGIDSVAFEVR